MTSTLNAAPGLHPGLGAMVHEQLTALAQRYDDAAERLGALGHRVGGLGQAHGAWTGPGSRAFRARVERHERTLARDVEACREAARSVRWAAAVLAERLAVLETAAELGALLVSVLSTLLGPGVVLPSLGSERRG
ncbi:hypothetical protein JNE43_01395 [Kocuria rhizophila]|uniref:WXG100-like domain-containing protein n=1 Tax=Kocuria rhizophila TaxID=72000 RepID=UPI001DB73AF8|nr:hypothetical protein [Kocuria rhizophila]MCC5673492.1 hypothetical protein [Kocuria rhizophila]